MSLLALGSMLVPAFPPAYAGSGLFGIRSPITVAVPRRIHTGFLVPPSPLSPGIIASRTAPHHAAPAPAG